MRIPHPPTKQGHNAWKQDFQLPPARGDASPIEVDRLVEIHARGFVFENDPCGRLEELAGAGGGIFYASTPLGSPAARASARRETLHLKTLHRVIDCLQERFASWATQDAPGVDADVLCRAHLAAHEWLADLIQHADFKDRIPQIAFSVWTDGDRLRCLIVDNSEGLDHVDGSPGDLMSDCETLPEQVIRWLFIRACTDQVTYRPFGNQGYCLEFSIG